MGTYWICTTYIVQWTRGALTVGWSKDRVGKIRFHHKFVPKIRIIILISRLLWLCHFSHFQGIINGTRELIVRTYESKGTQTQVEGEIQSLLAPHRRKVGLTSLSGIFLPLYKFILHPLFICPNRVCGQLDRWPAMIDWLILEHMTRLVTFEPFDQSDEKTWPEIIFSNFVFF